MHTPELFDFTPLSISSPPSQTYQCRLLSPMFMYGVHTPTIREESILGTLHFWYRALWGHALSLTDIRRREQQLFGCTESKGSSFVSISFTDQPESAETPVKPHKPKEFKKKAFQPGTTFTITISENLVNLFLIVSLLGGFGGRARRGFGAIQITEGAPHEYRESFPDNLLLLLQKYLGNDSLTSTPFLSKDNIEHILFPTLQPENAFPYIKAIYFGENVSSQLDTLLVDINQPTSDLTRKDADAYKFQMGGINLQRTKPRIQRFASPLVASLIQEGDDIFPIITRLHNTMSGDSDIQDTYIRRVLNP